MTVRLDKWLQIARVFKTRSQATKSCNLSRVRVNEQIAKPHKELAIGDRVEVQLRDRKRILIVRELRDKPLPKPEVARLFEDQSPPPPTRDPMAALLRRPPVQREKGLGRPTKRERRRLERLRQGPPDEEP